LSDTNPTGSILVRRGPTTDRLAFCPLKSEIIYDTTNDRFYIGDGQTFGGVSINQRDFPNTGVMIKGTQQEQFLVAPGRTQEESSLVQFLSFEKTTGQYSFATISSSGVAITSLKLSGTNGIIVTRTDSDPDVTNPTITTVGDVTFDINPATIFTNPAFTGIPIAPTAIAGTNTTQLATTAFVRTAISDLINGAPEALDTLNELSAALGNNANYATTITNALALKAPLESPAFTGNVSMANPLSVLYGGTGGTSASEGLTNLLPVGEVSGYVLTTSGRGGYYWAAAAGGGGSVGTAINTSRVTFTATSNQTIFTGVGTYTPGAGQLRVYIDGVRQFPNAYTETSSTSFTLVTGVPAGTKVFAEVDGYTSTVITASTITNSPAGSISSTDVQAALNELDTEKASLSSPTFTGITTFSSTIETFTSPTITSNQATMDYSLGSTFRLTANSANVKAIFTNVPTTANRIIPTTVIIAQGVTGYYINALSINGVDQVIRWVGGVNPTAVANQTGVVNFAFVCTAVSTYTVIASFVSYN